MNQNANAAERAASQAHVVELAEFQEQAPGRSILNGNLRLLDGVPVSLVVTLGEVATTVGQLMSLREAEVLTIDRAVEAPVDLVLNGAVVARGRLVVVDDNFGVQVTEVAGAQS